jgi:hypothetical protein
MIQELEKLKATLAKTSHLWGIFDSKWYESAKANLRSDDSNRWKPESYRVSELQDDRARLLQRLDEAIGLIKPLATQTKRTRPFKETLQKLKSAEVNQFRASVFELLSIARLIHFSQAAGWQIELYPLIGQTKKTVEARVAIDKEWNNFEAKSLGFSTRDIGMRKGGSRVITSSVEIMDQQIYDALFGKDAQQLSMIPAREPNIVLLSLGHAANNRTAKQAVKKALLSPDALNISAVLLFESYRCIRTPELITNRSTACPRILRPAGIDFIDAFAIGR